MTPLTGDGSGVCEPLLEPVLAFFAVLGSSVFLRPSPPSNGDSLGVRCCCCEGRGGEEAGDFLLLRPGDLFTGPELSLTDGIGYWVRIINTTIHMYTQNSNLTAHKIITVSPTIKVQKHV